MLKNAVRRLPLILASVLMAGAAAAADYQARFSVSVAPDQPATLAANRFAEAVKSRSNGRLEVRVYPSEQLGGEPDVVQGVRLGAVQIAFMSPGALGNIMADFQILNGPFLWNDWDIAKAVLNGPFGQKLYEKFRTETGIRIADPLWYWGWREMTANRPIRKPEDLRGLKMRAPNIPIFVEMFKALGANPTTVNFQEIYSALQQGVVDGQENPVPAIWAQRFYEVNKVVSLTHHILQSNLIIVNDKFFQSLPQDLQTIFQEEISKAGAHNTELQQKAERDQLAKIREAGGTIVEDVDRAAFRAATLSVYETLKGNWSPNLHSDLEAAIKSAGK
ncbi:TRAP transporter substrate-binding protein [Chelatococcus sp. GCM10030263]|uniref:TRAP transporter substrate-binding protein n=1 Tax=Chelatococcus sp. GCM10030263 TaxID=3273387 RepID=UPI00361367EF